MKTFTLRHALLSLALTGCLFFSSVQAQNVGINTTGAHPHTDAILDLNTGNAGTVGFLPPHVSLSNVTSASPFTPPLDKGLLVYDTNATTTGGNGVGYYYWSGTTWLYIYNTGSAGSSSWALAGNTGNSASNYLGTTDNNPVIFKTDGTEGARLTSSGVANKAGNFGIHTKVPYSFLDDSGAYAAGDTTISNSLSNLTVNLTGNYSSVFVYPSTSPSYYTDINLPNPTTCPRRFYTITNDGSYPGSGAVNIYSSGYTIYGIGNKSFTSAGPLNLEIGSVTVQSTGGVWLIVSEVNTGGFGGASIGVQTTTPESTLDVDGSLAYSDTTVANSLSNLTVNLTGNYSSVFVYPSTSPSYYTDINLPNPTTCPRRFYTITNEGSYPGSGAVNIYSSGYTIYGIGNKSFTSASPLDLEIGSVTVQSTGGVWLIVSEVNTGGFGGASIGVQTTTPESTLDVDGSLAYSDTTVANSLSNLTVNLTGNYSSVFVSPSTSPSYYTDINLPNPTTCPRRFYTITNEGSYPGSGAVNIYSSGYTIYGIGNKSFTSASPLDLEIGSVTVQSTGGVWLIVSEVNTGGFGGASIGVQTTTPESTLDVDGSLAYSDTTVANSLSNLTVNLTGNYSSVFVSPSTSPSYYTDINLPNPTTCPRRFYTITNDGSYPGSGAVNIYSSGYTIYGIGNKSFTSAAPLNLEIGSVTVQSTGGVWLIVSEVNTGGFGGSTIGIRTTTPVSTLDANGSYGVNDTDITTAASYTLTATQSTVLLPVPSVSTYTITLPNATTVTRRIYTLVFEGTANGNTYTIKDAAANSIYEDGTSNASITLGMGSVTLQSNGTFWTVNSYWSGTPTTSGPWQLSGNSGITASTSAIGTAANNNYIGTNNTADYVMAANGYERMRIANSSGYVGIDNTAPASGLDANTSFGMKDTDYAVSATTTYTMSPTIGTLNIIASPTNTTILTVKLPAPTGCSRRIYTVNYEGQPGYGPATLNTVSGNLMLPGNVTATLPITLQFGSITVQSDGTNWRVISEAPLGGAGGGFVGVNTATPTSVFDIDGSYGVGDTDYVVNAISTYTLSSTVSTLNIIANATATKTIAVTLPAANLVSRRIYTVNYEGQPGYGPATLNTVSGNLMLPGNVTATLPITLQFGSITVQSDGTNWRVISEAPLGGAGGGFVGVNTATPTSVFDIDGSYGVGDTNYVVNAISTYTLSSTISTLNILANATAAKTIAVTLPAANLVSRRIYTVNYEGQPGYGPATLNTVSGNLMLPGNVTATLPITLQFGSITVQSDGTNWRVISEAPLGGAGGGFVGVNTATPTSVFDIEGSYGVGDTNYVVNAISTYTLSSTISTLNILANATATKTITASLPAANYCPRRIYIVNYEGLPSYGPATINAVSGNIILPGNVQVASFVLQFGSATFQSDGTNWRMTSQSPLGGAGGNFVGVVNDAPLSNLDVAGSYGVGDTSFTVANATSYTINISSPTSTLLITPAGAGDNSNIFLPSPTYDSRRIYTIVYNKTAGNGSLTIETVGNDDIYLNGTGATTYTLTGGTITLQSNGTAYYILNDYPALFSNTVYPVTTNSIAYSAATDYTQPTAATTFSVVTGSSVTLQPGTYLITASADVGSSAAGSTTNIVLENTTSTTYYGDQVIATPTATDYYPWSVTFNVTLTAAATYEIMLRTTAAADAPYTRNARINALRVQ